MRYTIDHDYHIHTYLSLCSQDPGQTPEGILKIAKENGLKRIALTDHYWDTTVPCNTKVNPWYEMQNFDHIYQSCPLPHEEGITYLFGCEVDMDSLGVIGLPKSRWEAFDFIIVSTTHFHHMCGPEWENPSNQVLAKNWVKRMDDFLNAELPFEKVGIAHLATDCININSKSRKDLLETLDAIPADDMERIFAKAARLGVGIELNASDMEFAEDETDAILRMFRIAKKCGCKFYLGSDAHNRVDFERVHEIFERAIHLLDLEESDKYGVFLQA